MDYASFVKEVHATGGLVTCAADIMSLALLKSPGEFGVDICVGNTQRFGVPLGYGGPHAAYFAVKDDLKRRMPGRLIGVSKDAHGKLAYRLALQTREQHIRREKATSNICTAQALLANMSAMYAVYHGPEGIRAIAQKINNFAMLFSEAVRHLGHRVRYETFFDTVVVELNHNVSDLITYAEDSGINIRVIDAKTISVTFDETESKEDLIKLIRVFSSSPFMNMYTFGAKKQEYHALPNIEEIASDLKLGPQSSENHSSIQPHLVRTSKYLQHPVFNSYHSETEMLRYITHLQSKDLSLANAMIPLGNEIKIQT